MASKSTPATPAVQGKQKKRKRLRVLHRERCIGCFLCMWACTRTRVHEWSLEKSAIRVRIIGGDEGNFSLRVCHACLDPPCARACPESALKIRPGGGVLVVEKKCTGCGKCRLACDLSAIQWDADKNKPVICIHCGSCVEYCPHGVLGIEEVGL